MRAMPKSEWRVQLPEHHEGYITAEEFERNQQQLAHNRTNAEGTVLSGPAREGLALLQGLVLCAKCGRSLTVRYRGNGGIYPTYDCNWLRRDGLATKSCLSVRTDLLDAAVTDEALKVLQPAELALALAALDNLEERDQDLMRQWNMRIERASYECALAERRYEEVDPSNRLVASSLEQRWNKALVNLDTIRAEAAAFQSQRARIVTPEQRAKIMNLAQDLPRVWQASTTQSKDRKRMLRLLIDDITVPSTGGRYRRAPSRVSDIVCGQRPITVDTALRLGLFFRMDARFWLNLQSEYDIRMATRSIDHVAKRVRVFEPPVAA
jgi:addiction module HigA family antidote